MLPAIAPPSFLRLHAAARKPSAAAMRRALDAASHTPSMARVTRRCCACCATCSAWPHEVRLRHGALRRLHCACRRRAHPFLPAEHIDSSDIRTIETIGATDRTGDPRLPGTAAMKPAGVSPPSLGSAVLPPRPLSLRWPMRPSSNQRAISRPFSV